MLREQHHSRTMTASGYCKLVFDLSQQLRSGDVEALQYMYKVATENVTNLGVLKELEKRGVFSSSNMQGLKTLLCNIDRCDLLDMLREDKRLELCYLQAVSMEKKLEAIRVDLAQFCAKQECSPTERSFCGGITERVQEVQRETREYLIRPLKDVYLENTDGRLSSTRPGSVSTAIRRSESARDSPVNVKTYPHIPKPQQFTQKSQASPPGQKRCMSAQDSDYDQLSPVGSHVTSTAIPNYAYAILVETDSTSRDARCKQQRRIPKDSCSIAIADTRNADTRNAVYPKLLATSVPSTPLFAQRRALNRSSSSDNLLAATQGSKLPIKKKSSLNACRHSSGSDLDTSGGSGEDSGFTDASEFALFKLDSQRTLASSDHVYSRPNKFTVNEHHTYSVPTKR